MNTIKDKIIVKGKGIHSGNLNCIEIIPNNIGKILFINKKTGSIIEANIDNVNSTYRATTLTNGLDKIYTVEHLLSFLYVFDISSISIYYDKEELPILDGSSYKWHKLFKDYIVKSDFNQKYLYIDKPIFLKELDSWIYAVPYNSFRVIYYINYYKEKVLPFQKADVNIDKLHFLYRFGFARTYGFLKELHLLYKENLAKGGNLYNSVVITNNGIIRYLKDKNEMVYHKILDFVGDMALLNRRMKGLFFIYKGSHKLHIDFVKRLKEIYF